MSGLMELRPPPEHANKRLHWIRYEGGAEDVWTWNPGKGRWDRTSLIQSNPADAYGAGYRYLGPAEWRPPTMIAWSIPGDPNVWVPELDRLTLQERARLVEIAEDTVTSEIRAAALDVLKAAAIVSAMELHPPNFVGDQPEPLIDPKDAPYA